MKIVNSETLNSKPVVIENNIIAHTEELVINWHVTEKCNYHCNYCFSKYEKVNVSKEICMAKDLHRSELLLTHLYSFFQSKYGIPVRINFAGGEPLLVPKLIPIMQLASDIGFRVSVITNGSLLTPDLTEQMKSIVSTIGISIDSVSKSSMIDLGRCTNGNRLVDMDNLLSCVKVLKLSGVNIKLNTVVNKINWLDDMSLFVDIINPDKWKILKVLPVVTDTLNVTEQQFNTFIETHSAYSKIVITEDNDLMTNSYIMIDPFGRFFQNSDIAKSGYSYSEPLFSQEIIATEFNRYDFDLSKFTARY